MTPFNNTHIISVGGAVPCAQTFVQRGIQISQCFAYDVKGDWWFNVPALKLPRSNCALCVCFESLLYAFGGIAYEYGRIGDIERWKVVETEGCFGGAWEQVWVRAFCGMEVLVRSHACALQVSESKILVFGGSERKKVFDSVFEFDLEDCSIRQKNNMKTNGAFFYSSFSVKGNAVWAVDNESILHKYTIQDDSWDCFNLRELETDFNYMKIGKCLRSGDEQQISNDAPMEIEV